MKHLSLRNCVASDIVFWCVAALSSSAFAWPFAMRFEDVTFPLRLLASAGFLVLALSVTWLYRARCVAATYPKIAVGAIIMALAASAVYSVARHEIVLVVFPSLFTFAGATFGAALAQACVAGTKRASEAVAPSSSNGIQSVSKQEALSG